jgi:hypothetical protein
MSICLAGCPATWMCNSESDAECSYHGESLEGMCTPNMLDPDGKPRTNLARLTTEHANALHARGRDGGQVTAGDAGQTVGRPIPRIGR